MHCNTQQQQLKQALEATLAMIILPQPMTAIATAAVGATILLSAASVSNMYETYAIVKQHTRQLQLSSSSSSPQLPEVVSKSRCWKTIDEAINGLSNMKKKELVELFLNCNHPDLDTELVCYHQGGGWIYDGYSLDNGPILTSVSDFITNRLFGRGEKWLGKAYLKPASYTNKASGVGKNRFSISTSKDDERLDRRFDYYIGKSVLPLASSSSGKSLFNNYAPHCSIFSPVWRGMRDELRVVPLNRRSKGKDETILLGMGYFTFTGGVWNLAPFCLVPRRCSE